MKSNVIMESLQDRQLMIGDSQVVVRQRTKDKFFSLRDTERVINLHRFNVLGESSAVRLERYFGLESTKAFIKSLREKKQCEPYLAARGKSEGWIHPHLFLDILLWANPRFKVEIYDWLFDYLIESRINSSDSFRLMSATLYEFVPRKDKFKPALTALCKRIKELLGVDDWNKASETQLKRRDELQNLIADLTATTRRPKIAVSIAFENYRRKFLKNT